MRREGVILYAGAVQGSAWLTQLPTTRPSRPPRKSAYSRGECIIQVAWANRARISQGRASNSQEVLMEQEETYVGIDVAKAQVDVAIRPADDRWRGLP